MSSKTKIQVFIVFAMISLAGCSLVPGVGPLDNQTASPTDSVSRTTTQSLNSTPDYSSSTPTKSRLSPERSYSEETQTGEIILHLRDVNRSYIQVSESLDIRSEASRDTKQELSEKQIIRRHSRGFRLNKSTENNPGLIFTESTVYNSTSAAISAKQSLISSVSTDNENVTNTTLDPEGKATIVEYTLNQKKNTLIVSRINNLVIYVVVSDESHYYPVIAQSLQVDIYLDAVSLSGSG